MMSANELSLVIIATFLAGLIIGCPIGYWYRRESAGIDAHDDRANQYQQSDPMLLLGSRGYVSVGNDGQAWIQHPDPNHTVTPDEQDAIDLLVGTTRYNYDYSNSQS